MKRLIILTSLLIAFSTTNARSFVVRFDMNFDYFYTSLEPYGEWIEIDNDVVVWRPSYVRHSWRPYSEGRWTYTNHGWYWDSYEPFGWATYHYGRWYNDDYYGWVWFPDNEWGPSWVEWRYNDNYIGWAPLPPYASFHVDFGIRFSIGWHSRHSYWNFVSYPRFCHREVNYYIVDNSTNINIYNNTKYRTNYNYRDGRIYNGGIDRNFIERRGGYRVAERSVRTTNDYSSYKQRDNNSDAVVTFRPGERELQNSRGIEKSKIVRGKSKSTIEVSKITTRSVNTYPRTDSKNKSRKDIVRKTETKSNTSVDRKSNKPNIRSNEAKSKSKNIQNNKRSSTVSKTKSKDGVSSKRDVVKKDNNKKQINTKKSSILKKTKVNKSKKSYETQSKSKSYSKTSSKKKSELKQKSYSSKKNKNSKSYKPKSSKKSSVKSHTSVKKSVPKRSANSNKTSR